MADSKKKGEEFPVLKEQEELRKIIEKYSTQEKRKELAPSELNFATREFKEFQQGYFAEGQPKTFFERACRFSGKILTVGIKKEDEDKLNEILYYTGTVVKPQEIISLSILTFLIFLILGAVAFFAFGGIGSEKVTLATGEIIEKTHLGFPAVLLFIISGLVMLVGVQKYPVYLQRLASVETLNSMPLAITYMVIYMRASPTLEGAVRFTAVHLPGPLGRDLKKLVWDLENGTYLSMDQALSDYATKWQQKNQSFATAVELLRNSVKIGDEKERIRTLDEASKIVMRGNLDMMIGFARGLRLPIVILYMLGIVLPVMGLVIAPIMTTLMGSGLSAPALIVVYNILLPFVIYIMLKIVLSNRPGGFTVPDIEGYPGVPKPGHYLVTTRSGREYQIPLFWVSLIVFFIVASPGLLMLTEPQPAVGFDVIRIIRSLTIIVGASAAIIIYTLGSAAQKLKIRKEMEEVEEGMDSAFYELGEKIAMGTPIENAIMRSAEEMKGGAMRGFFYRLGASMQNLGLPLDRALFDPENGALRFYPSKTLSTIMEVLLESTKKGLQSAAVSLKTIASFLGNLRSVKNNIENSTSKTVTSMKFQAQFLTSFIAGIIIALDILMFKILTELNQRVVSIQLPKDVSAASVGSLFKSSFFNVASVVPAEHMQLIVGFYMIEVTILLSLMVNGVMRGRDDVNKNYIIGYNLIAGTFVYIVALILGMMLFISFNLSPGGFQP